MLSLIPLLATCSLFVSSTLAGPGFTGQPVISAYYPSYNMAPSAVPYKQYTHLQYFVVTTTSSPTTLSLAGIQPSVITDFVTRAHAAGTKVSYTVGGWTGSRYFSQHLATSTNRTIFARALVQLMSDYKFDGIDIDWEYPGEQGIGNNIVAARDSTNLLALLMYLRQIAPSARLSIAVSVNGLMGSNGRRIVDMTAWVPYLDYLTIMTYDIFGSWGSTTGPNSPLYSTCNPSDNQASIDSAVTFYTTAGIPAKNILVGFASYAYAFTVSNGLLASSCSDGTKSLAFQKKSTTTVCGNWVGEPSPSQFLYRELLASGWLNATGPAGFNVTTRDRATATTLIYNPKTDILVETEDGTTARIKATWVNSKGLGGVNMFDLNGDDPTGGLVYNLRRGMGLK